MNTDTQTPVAEITTSERISALRLELAVLEESELAKLRVAEDHEVEAICEYHRCVDVSHLPKPKELGLNTVFRLDDVQKAQVGVAKAEHKQAINAPTVRTKAVELVTRGKLAGFKMRATAKGLTFSVKGVVK